MVKQVKSSIFLQKFLVLFTCGIAGCSGSKTRLSPLIEHPLASTLTETPASIHKLWTQRVPGLMTDLSVSRDGSVTVIATVPNPDAVDGPRETGHGLSRFNRAGLKLWHIELPSAVRTLALSGDGKLALLSTYDNRLTAIDASGKVVWSVEAMCKPIALQKRFLCYHDDDAESDVAFDIYSDTGRKELFYPITRDVLALKISDDGRNTAIALAGGQVILFGPEFTTVWQRSVRGEVVDLALSSGEHPRVAALFNSASSSDADKRQEVDFFEEKGDLVGHAVPQSRAIQIESVPSGLGFVTYGNGPQGQVISYYNWEASLPIPAISGKKPVEIVEKWQRGDPHAADFSSSLIVTRDLIIFGFESIAATARHSHLLAFDFAGDLKWNIPLVSEEGAYLYSHGFAPLPSLVSVGTDDGYLSAFQVQASQPVL